MQNSVAGSLLATSASTSGFISAAPTSSMVSATSGLSVMTPRVAIPSYGFVHEGSGGRLSSFRPGAAVVARDATVVEPEVAAALSAPVVPEAAGDEQPIDTSSRHADMSNAVLRITGPKGSETGRVESDVTESRSIVAGRAAENRRRQAVTLGRQQSSCQSPR